MADEASGRVAEPDGAPRIATLDVLRGIAILGILFMNINDMGGSLWASNSDVRHLGWSQVDQVAWWIREILANGTARCMLEMLFGVGMVILTDRFATAATDRWTVLRRYYVRNFVLFLFGLVHIFILLWPGDILHTYGLAAMVAVLFRRLGPKWLLAIGGFMAMVQLVGGGWDIHQGQQRRAEVAQLEARKAAGQVLTKAEATRVEKAARRKAERAAGDAEDARRTALEDKARSADQGATFRSWAAKQWGVMLLLWGGSDEVGSIGFLEWMFVWEAASTMLIGAALFKWGVIQGARPRHFYGRATLAAYAVGFTLRAVDAYWSTQFDGQPHMIYAASEVARLATTLGHVCAVNWLLKSAGGARALRPFAAAGRTALSIYIAQTLICLWILYPPFALGLYGRQGWAALMVTALAINAALLWGANVYVRHYAIAPVEWAWRSIIARRLLPIRHGTAADRSAGPVGAA